MKHMLDSLVLFSPDLPILSKNEREVLDLLLEAGKLISPLYEKQLEIGFYPEGITKKQIEEAAKDDPGILSPYTIVEKHGAKMVAVPYNKKFEELLKPVVVKLNEAADLTENNEFKKRLRAQAQALLDGSYEAAAIICLTLKPYILDINIGPIERYDDKLFFVKTSYQCWVGVMDEGATKRFEEYKKTILSARRQSLMPSEKVDYYDKTKVRVDNLLLLSGLIARTKFVGVNLPNDPNLMEKYGSNITLFHQTNQIRHKNNLAIFNRIFAPSFRSQFSEVDLREGSLYSTALHELAHTYLRYRDSESRLRDLFPVIDELAATVMGIKVCGTLLLKDMITPKQLESIMLAYMCRGFYNIFNEQSNTSKSDYIIGGAIYINYLIESGALREVGGISWPNFTKMFVAISELATILERILSTGVRDDAKSFISKYGEVENLRRFE